MTWQKEIEEMAGAIMATEYFDDGASCLNYKCQENCNCGGYGIAEELYNEGYRKIVWHKVADGDLPEESAEVYCCYNCPIGIVYVICSYFTDDGEETPHFYCFDNCFGSKEGWIRQDDIIAWTELPKYEGEE